jgi:AcrR family transcriptional regulator
MALSSADFETAGTAEPEPAVGDLDSVLGDRSSVFRLRVLRATRRLLADRGLSVSMDDIATAADVGRRSLFRHFGGRDTLVAEALSGALDWYDEQVVRVDDAEASLESWLERLIRRIHQMHIAAGRGMWQMAAAADDELAPEIAEVNRRRRHDRRATTETIAREAWQRAGGRGKAPRAVSDACALAISSFATRSMVDDFSVGVAELAKTTAAMLSAFIEREASAAASRRAAKKD